MDVFCGIVIMSPSYIFKLLKVTRALLYYSLFFIFIHVAAINEIGRKPANNKGNPCGSLISLCWCAFSQEVGCKCQVFYDQLKSISYFQQSGYAYIFAIIVAS